jgi:polysaccharide chain length determinant protein (PEP-CTERM system associated)
MAQQQMTLPYLIRAFRRRKNIFILTFLTFFLIAVVLALALSPVYKSTATILIEEQDIPTDYVKATVTTFAEQQLQIIRQRIMTATKLMEIINRYNLYADLKDRETTEEIVDRMRKDINLDPISVDLVDPKTGHPSTATIAFTLSYEGKNNAGKVQQISNVLTSLFLEENVKVRERQASDISLFLEDEMKKVKADLDDIDKRMAAFKNRHITVLPELLQVNLTTLNNLQHDRQLIFERLSSLKEREGSLTAELAGTPADLYDFDKKRLEELELDLVSLNKRFSQNYPDVINAREEIEELKKKLAGESGPGASHSGTPDNPAYISLNSQLKSIQGEISALNAQIADIDRSLVQYRGRIEQTPNAESGYSQLLADRNNTQAKYDDLMRKLMEARVSQGLEREQKGERFTLIEPASLPEKPIKPNRIIIILSGLVLGIGAGSAVAGFKEFTDESVQEPDEFRGMSAFTLLGTIPMIANEQDRIRARKRRNIILLGSAISFVLMIAAIHFLFMHLDVLWIKMLIRLGITGGSS